MDELNPDRKIPNHQRSCDPLFGHVFNSNFELTAVVILS